MTIVYLVHKNLMDQFARASWCLIYKGRIKPQVCRHLALKFEHLTCSIVCRTYGVYLCRAMSVTRACSALHNSRMAEDGLLFVCFEDTDARAEKNTETALVKA